jgi:hypothetical protein
MRTPSPLPEPIEGRAFHVREARDAGVTRKRTRARDLVAPFHGVRSPVIGTVVEHAAAYRTRMAQGHVFGGVTAARLWGLPLPTEWSLEEPLVIARANGATRGRAVGTRHIAVDPRLMAPAEQHGLPLLTPVATTITLARELDHERLVHVVDALLTDSALYPDLQLPRSPHATAEQLREFLAPCDGLRGVRAMLAALDDARAGVDSRYESITRRTIVLAGLPEPVVHPLVRVEGIDLHPDLAYPELKIAIEYEGDGHREQGRWDRDIDRYALLEAAGWIVVRITKAHLARDGERCVARVAAARARRSW